MPPLLAPLIALVLGILISPNLDTYYVWLTLPLATLICLLRHRYACFTLFLLGAGLDGCQRLQPQEIPDDGYPVRLTGVLEEAPRKRGSSYYLTIRVESVRDEPGSGRARLYFFPDGTDAEARFNGLELGSGDVIGTLVRLHRPTSYRNPGGFDYGRYLERRGIYWTGTIRNSRLIEVLDRGWHGLDRLRDWVERRVGSRFQDDPSVEAIVLGMVLGQSRRLPVGTARQFRAAGLIHLLVVSGFNLAIVAGAALWLAKQLPFGRNQRIWSRIFALALIASYALLVEGDAPVVRATLMAGFLIVGAVLDRGYAIGNALAATAMAILILDPQSLGEGSFQLTFASVVAILLVGIPLIGWKLSWLPSALKDLDKVDIDRHLPVEIADWRISQRLGSELSGWPLWTVKFRWLMGIILVEAAVISLSVQTVLLPLTVESYHRISPVAIPLNVFGALTAAVITPLGLLLIVLPDPLAMVPAWAMRQLLELLLLAIQAGLQLPGATTRVPSPPGWIWLLYGLALACLVWALREPWIRCRWICMAIVVGLQVSISIGDFSPPPPTSAVLTFLDVGQGDSTLVELPDGRRIVVDGGGVQSGQYRSVPNEGIFSVGEDVVSKYLFSRRFRRLDVIVLTHAHHDHMDGLFDLIENFEVGEIWLGRNPIVPRYRELLESIYKGGIPIRWVASGDRVDPFIVLNPPRDHRVQETVQNDDSIVLMLETRGLRALLPGDFEGALDNLPDRIDILKIPHHGSRNTRLETSAPIRIISVGARNPFGHPDPSKLPALRTDLLGAIQVALEDPPDISFPGLEGRPFN